MFLFTTWTGHETILHLMRKIFRFKNLEEVPKNKRKSIIFDLPMNMYLNLEKIANATREMRAH